jgi:hypothetical protein
VLLESISSRRIWDLLDEARGSTTIELGPRSLDTRRAVTVGQRTDVACLHDTA